MRKLLVTGTVGIILGGAVAGLVLAWSSAAKQAAAAPALPPATVEVIRTTLVETRTVAGTLGYGDLTPISATGTGTLTWIAPVGSTVTRGEPLFKVDEHPVVAFYGPVPMYRTLREGTAGSDVLQLQENLAELGYTITVDGKFTSGSGEVVRIWQAELGLPYASSQGLQVDIDQAFANLILAKERLEKAKDAFEPYANKPKDNLERANLLSQLSQAQREYDNAVRTYNANSSNSATVKPDQLVFIPGAIRIGEHAAQVGDVIGNFTTVLSYTDTSRQVSVQLNLADLALAAVGNTVTVTIPGVGDVEGKVSAVGTVVLENVIDVIEVTITIADQQALGTLDAAPVDINFVSEEREDVLAVPVAALLALAEGGFGVEVVDGDTTRIVAVKTGMFAAGLVEVSGEGIAEGVRVGIPE